MWEVFEAERPYLMAYRGPFDGFRAVETAVSKTCLVRFDRNQYSVEARAVGRPVDVQAYADGIVIRQDGDRVAEHPRCFERNQVIYDPWHYVPVLTRKPGALRNGAPFKDWRLPGAAGPDRTRLHRHADGDRQVVKVLGAVLEDGLGGGRGGLLGSLGWRRLQRRCGPQHPGPAAPARAPGADADTGGSVSSP